MNMSSSPSWSLVPPSDQEIRRNMVNLMTDDSMALAEALKRAVADPVVKERYFTTPPHTNLLASAPRHI